MHTTSISRRTASRVAGSLVAGLLATGLTAAPGTADARSTCEKTACGVTVDIGAARDDIGSEAAPVFAYAEPQPALHGLTLAQYVADHQAHLLWVGV